MDHYWRRYVGVPALAFVAEGYPNDAIPPIRYSLYTMYSRECKDFFKINLKNNWLQESDLNRRPSGYEPDELPLLHPASN